MTHTVTHTPGPWIVNDYAREPYNKLVIVADGPISIAVLLADPIDKTKSPAQQRSNAHLIAAAPELLMALEASRKFLGEVKDSLARMRTVRIIDNAIAKAKGLESRSESVRPQDLMGEAHKSERSEEGGA